MHLYDETNRAAPGIYGVIGDRGCEIDGRPAEAQEHDPCASIVWARPGSRASALIAPNYMAEAPGRAPLTSEPITRLVSNLRVRLLHDRARDERSGSGAGGIAVAGGDRAPGERERSI